MQLCLTGSCTSWTPLHTMLPFHSPLPKHTDLFPAFGQFPHPILPSPQLSPTQCSVSAAILPSWRPFTDHALYSNLLVRLKELLWLFLPNAIMTRQRIIYLATHLAMSCFPFPMLGC